MRSVDFSPLLLLLIGSLLGGCVIPEKRRSEDAAAALETADMLIARQQYERAAQRMQLSLAKSNSGSQTPLETAAFLIKLAEARSLLGDAKASEESYRQAIKALGNAASELRVHALSSLGLLLQSQNQLDQALPLYKKAYSLSRRLYGKTDVRTLTRLQDIAALHRAAKNPAREEAVLHEILAAAAQSKRKSAYLDALEDLAVFSQTRGEDASALRFYAAAVEQLERAGLQGRQAERIRAAYAELKRRRDAAAR